MKILLIGADSNEEAMLSHALQRVGLEPVIVQDVEAALELHERQPTEMMILALQDSLLQAARRLRQMVSVPLVILIDEMAEDEQLALIEAGRAILVARPYRVRLLATQLLVFLHLGDGFPRKALSFLQRGEVTLYPSRQAVKVGDRPELRLAKLEFTLLYILMQHARQIVTTDALIEHVWGHDYGDETVLRTLVWRLRKKVEPVPERPQYIIGVRGVGYRFEGGGEA